MNRALSTGIGSILLVVSGCTSCGFKIVKPTLETPQGEILNLMERDDGARQVLYRKQNDLIPRLVIQDFNRDGIVDNTIFQRVPSNHPYRTLSPDALQALYDKALR